MTDLSALLSRVEAAHGPDRELDAAIDVELLGGETIWLTANFTMEPYPATRRASGDHVGGFVKDHVPLYTTSLDATVALVEKLRPDWFFTISNFCPSLEKRAWADVASLGYINEEDGCGDQRSEGHGYAPTCALLAALLRSMIEEEGK